MATAASMERRRFVEAHPYAFLLPVTTLRRGRREPCLRTDALASPFHVVRASECDGPLGSVRVGRSGDCEVVLDDPRVSRHHATFERSGRSGDYALLDAGSRNGVRVDAVKLSAWSFVALSSRARVSFGGVELLFVSALDLYDMLRPLARPSATVRTRRAQP